jgi:RimJ/RimL family protein N-acetyltransferase
VTLSPRRAADRLAAEPLLARFDVHLGHLGSVLLGLNPGSVWTDDAVAPSSALVLPDDGFAYLSCVGDADGFVRECGRILFEVRPRPCVEVMAAGTELEGRLEGLFGGRSHFAVPRLAWDPPEPEETADAGLPPGFEPAWREGPGFMELSALAGGAVAGACRAWVWRGEAELDVHAEEAWRRRGLGAALVATFVRRCLSDGLRPRWTCWADNEASMALARRSGFRRPREVLAHIHDEEA